MAQKQIIQKFTCLVAMCRKKLAKAIDIIDFGKKAWRNQYSPSSSKKTDMAHEQQWRRNITACASAGVTACALMAAALATAQVSQQGRSTVQSQLQSQLQYSWIDDNGIKHFSDRPPAPSVPRNRMLREPDTTPTMTQVTPLQTSEPGQKSTAPSNIAERNADFIKRRTAAAAAEQQSAQDAERRAMLVKNCEDVLINQRLLESGAPIGSITADGSRIFLNDEARVLASKRNQDALRRCQ